MSTTAASDLPVTGRLIREHVLRESRRAYVGHIGQAVGDVGPNGFIAQQSGQEQEGLLQ